MKKSSGCILLSFSVLFASLLLSIPGISQEPEPYTFVLKWGGTGSGDGQFSQGDGLWTGGPRGIAVDSKNNIYVVDVGNHRIQKFNNQGNYLLQWGTYGYGDGQFIRPKGINVDNQDNIYVTEDDWWEYEVARVQV